MFQISNDLGNILYTQGAGILPATEKAMGLGQTTLHTMSVAVKYSKFIKALEIGKNFISSQKIFSFNDNNLYFTCTFFKDKNDLSLLYDYESLEEIVCEGILKTVYYCLVMLLGYKNLYDFKENIAKWEKAIKVL